MKFFKYVFVGILLSSCVAVDNKVLSDNNEYYANGKLAKESLDRNNYNMYDENGKLLYTFIGGNESDERIDGEELRESKFVDGSGALLNGEFDIKCYDDIEKVCKKQSFANGKLDGKQIRFFYDNSNDIRDEQLYKNGKVVFSDMVRNRSYENHWFMYKFDDYRSISIIIDNYDGKDILKYIHCGGNGESKHYYGKEAEEIYENFNRDRSKNPCPRVD